MTDDITDELPGEIEYDETENVFTINVPESMDDALHLARTSPIFNQTIEYDIKELNRYGDEEVTIHQFQFEGFVAYVRGETIRVDGEIIGVVGE